MSSYDTSTGDAGKLVLRVTVGGLLLLHGIAKISSGVDRIGGMLAGKGLPEAIAYGAYLGEVVAPVLVILGLFTRPAALIIGINMLFAVFLVHMGDLTQLTDNGGWRLELQAFYLFGALAVALLGAGRFSVGGAGGRYN